LGLVETFGGRLPGGLGPLWGEILWLGWLAAEGGRGWLAGAAFSGLGLWRLLAGRWGSMPRRAAAGLAGGGRR
jgi:hypothetical protein